MSNNRELSAPAEPYAPKLLAEASRLNHAETVNPLTPLRSPSKPPMAPAPPTPYTGCTRARSLAPPLKPLLAGAAGPAPLFKSESVPSAPAPALGAALKVEPLPVALSKFHSYKSVCACAAEPRVAIAATARQLAIKSLRVLQATAF